MDLRFEMSDSNLYGSRQTSQTAPIRCCEPFSECINFVKLCQWNEEDQWNQGI